MDNSSFERVAKISRMDKVKILNQEMDLCNYEGLSKCIMGILDQVQILEGAGLREFLTRLRTYIFE